MGSGASMPDQAKYQINDMKDKCSNLLNTLENKANEIRSSASEIIGTPVVVTSSTPGTSSPVIESSTPQEIFPINERDLFEVFEPSTPKEIFPISEKDLFNAIIEKQVVIVLTMCISPDNNYLQVRAFPISECSQENLKILSYRWDDGANQFQSIFDWGAALESLCTAGCKDVFCPDIISYPNARNFYDSLLKIFTRAGLHYLWVDQLCIPQNRPETMAMVKSLGSLYKQYDVLIWVPWVMKEDNELVNYVRSFENALLSGDIQFAEEVMKDMNYLTLQLRRGWILRECCADCNMMETERKRNIVTVICGMSSVIDRLLRYASEDLKNTLLSYYSQFEQLMKTLIPMTGNEMRNEDKLLLASRLTVAEFTKESDRSVVAEMEGMILVENSESNASSIQNQGRYKGLLRMLGYFGTGSYKSMPFHDFPEYTVGSNVCQKIANWILTLNKSAIIYLDESAWKKIHSRLINECSDFSCFLPIGLDVIDAFDAVSQGNCCVYIYTSGVRLVVNNPGKMGSELNFSQCHNNSEVFRSAVNHGLMGNFMNGGGLGTAIFPGLMFDEDT